MKKRFTLSLIALIASAFLFVITSFAWYILNTSSSIDPFPGKLSGIVYDLGGDFIEKSVIYPELELINTPVTITNYSDEDLYLRVKVQYTRINVSYDSQNFTYSITDPFQKNYDNIPNEEHIVVSMNYNFFYEPDGYWYYDGLLEDGIQHTLFTSIYYNGNDVSNEYATNDIIISIILEFTYDQEGIWSPLTTMVYTGTM
jgi:hypothetical protein